MPASGNPGGSRAIMTSSAQSQDSRDGILKAATQLFAGRGFHETSMSEVARNAQVSKALIFWHFKSKEELFLAVLNRLLEPYFIDFTEETSMLDERAQIERLVENYLYFVRDQASSVRFFLAQLLRSEQLSDGLGNQVLKLYESYRNLVVALIERGQEKGVCTRTFSAEVAAGFLMSALNGFVIEFLFMGKPIVDCQGALEMLGGWLFTREGPPKTSEGAKTVG
jgi:TetR/AcrR family fatty acid metabolism transcriptional regulator